MRPKYRRALLKIGGEVFSGEEKAIERTPLDFITGEIEDAVRLGTTLGVVVGGGNMVRGANASALGIDRVTGDYMGMLGTMINGLALRSCLVRRGVEATVMSAIEMGSISERFVRDRAMRYLDEGHVLIFSCGTGNPYFTTDTAASLRAVQIEADVLLKGTKVDGVYEDDPSANRGARRLEKLSYLEYLRRGLKVMDSTSISFCMEQELPVVVFNIYEKGNLSRALLGEGIGSTVAH